jgi:hypothetical protein
MQMTLAYVNDPRNPAGKYGNVKSTAGETVMVPIAMLPLFRGREGQAVDVPTKIATWGQGTDAKQVTIATGGPGTSNVVGWQGTQRAPAPQQQAPQQPAPAYRPPAADKDARQIYITGVVGRAMGSGKFTASEILVLTKEAGDAYDKYVDPSKPKPALPAPVAYPELNDQVPWPGEDGDPGPDHRTQP